MGGTLSGTPTTPGTAHFTVEVTAAGGFTATQALTLTVQPAATPPVPPPPVLTPETVMVNGHTTPVIGNLGFNPATAVDRGTYVGFVEERAAVEAGATFSGEGTDASYLSAILDGSGVGQQQHVWPCNKGSSRPSIKSSASSRRGQTIR